MYFRILALAGASLLYGADQAQLALALKAQTDFDRVEMAATPQLRDAAECEQSQAALLAVAPAQELPLVHYRKGYCTAVGAVVTHAASEFGDAATEFDKAIQTWPGRAHNGGKDLPAAPVPAAVRVLASVARLKSGLDAPSRERERALLATALENPACPESFMSASFCESVLQVGRQWLGWIALDRGNLETAAREFSRSGAAGWNAWVEGSQAWQEGRYAEAVKDYENAIHGWTVEEQEPAYHLIERLTPAPDLVAAYTGLGGAQFLCGNAEAAIASLDEAVRRDPTNSRAIYLRGRARDKAGRPEQAMADYSLASRTAFAKATNLASGEAHLYRGVMLYQRKDYERAEGEFASALNFEIDPAMRDDASAWRYLAATAGGACGESEFLARSLVRVSPYFPMEEARAAVAACRVGTAP